jgi:hypothetical protein
MFLGLTFMAAGAAQLCLQDRQPQIAMAAADVKGDAKPDAASSAKSEQSAAAVPANQPQANQPPATHPPVNQGKADASPPDEAKKAEAGLWKDLFDGKTLNGWKSAQLGGEGDVVVEDGAIVLKSGGGPMTAVAWKGDLIRNNYELTLEGMRIEGSDFFCTTTFPVGKDPCSLVVGGWGGGLVGLSNVDHFDASENATTKIMAFKEKKWYRIRIRVSDAAIQAWIDDELVVKQRRQGHKFDIRIEVDACRPLGFATWYTTGAVRNVRVRPLTADEVEAAAAAFPASTDEN